MATSGSTDYTQTRTEVIEDALNLLGVRGVGRTTSSEDMAFAVSILNKMIKSWSSRGIHLFSREEAYLFLADNTGEYTLSSDSTSARAALRTDSIITELNGSHAASATTLVVDDTTGMAASDIIGIVLDDDAVTWTTIVSVDSSTGLTITAGLDSVAADNNNVYTFTSRITKPLAIYSMRRVQNVGTTESSTPMTLLTHQEYFDLPNKKTNGTPSHFFYDPKLTTGRLYLWPRPSDPELWLSFTYDRNLEDLDAASDNFDLPSNWLETITYQLAVRLAPAFGRDAKLQTLLPIASQMLQDQLDFDVEEGSIFFGPDPRS